MTEFALADCGTKHCQTENFTCEYDSYGSVILSPQSRLATNVGNGLLRSNGSQEP